MQSYNALPPKPLSSSESAQVAAFRSFRSRVHEGPYYAVLGDGVRVGKTNASPATGAAATFDPFEGMQKYSQKYLKRPRTLPKIDSRPYGRSKTKSQIKFISETTEKADKALVLKFFPKELWGTLDRKYAGLTNGGLASKMKSQKARRALKNIKDDGLEAEDLDNEDKPKNEVDSEGEPMDQDMDDTFEEGDDEGGDYNAEQYFNDGGDDAVDDYDGGEGGGEDFY